MSQEKSQFRLDMEARVMAGKSQSQQYRHALYEVWNQRDDKSQSFEGYYAEIMNQNIEAAMSCAESALLAKEL